MAKPIRPSSRLHRTLPRRAFVGGLAGAGMLAPFLPLARGRADDDDGYPRRLVLLFSPNGTLHEHWAPTGNADNWQMSTLLAPLDPFREQLVVVDGLHVLTNTGAGDEHQKGIGHLWTASPLAASTTGANGATVLWSTGPSLDQVVAQAIGSVTPHQSLEFGVLSGSHNVFSRMAYAGPGQPVAPEPSPSAMFDRLFGDFDADPDELFALKAHRKSVIDLVKSDLDALAPRLGSDDRHKLEAHLSAVREIEKRNDLAVPVCEVPLDPGTGTGGNAQFPTVSRLQIDLLVMALACDLTRVASIQWSKAVSEVVFEWLGHSQNHHDLSHLGDSDPNMQSSITAINVWYAEEVAYLLGQLAAIPEGDGTLLDHTLVVWGNELARGNVHSHAPVPFVLAGGGAFSTGRWLQVQGQPHNRLLVSIGQAMGLDIDTFGVTDPGAGGLPGLL